MSARQTVRIKPFVNDQRNLLLVKQLSGDNNRAFMTTLLHAIRRSVQLRYQVEEQEVEAELIGEGEYRRLMLWEAAEGGTGIWERMMEEPDAFRTLAHDALELCHCDPKTGADLDDSAAVDCAVACYQCLLSYSNQMGTPTHQQTIGAGLPSSPHNLNIRRGCCGPQPG